jgi:hypothetical protein
VVVRLHITGWALRFSAARYSPASLVLGWSLRLIYLFFSKKKSFPGSAIFFMVVSLVLVVIDLVIALMIPAL